jgi:hypothetical protein
MQSFGAHPASVALCLDALIFCHLDGDSGHHIIYTSADHSLSLPLLLSLWLFGLFNNHVSSRGCLTPLCVYQPTPLLSGHSPFIPGR